MEPPRDPSELIRSSEAIPPPLDRDPRARVLANIQASYFFLRRGMAFLALAFPLILWLGGGADALQNSMSAYYHAHQGQMRDVFVGILWAIGAFLFLYKGYSRQENHVLDFAGLCAIGVALFPMDWPESPDRATSTTGMIHGASAVLFFLAIAYVAVFRAKDTLPALADEAARSRFARLYRFWGMLMVIFPLTIVALHFLWGERLPRWLFFLEMAGIYVFSAFWLTKSREIAAIEKQA